MSDDRPRITLKLSPALAKFSEDFREHEERIAERNTALLEKCVAPIGPHAVRVGDRVLPNCAYWRRGPGVVDEVDKFGRVWVVYGPREGAGPSDSRTVRCFSPWEEVRIVERAER